MTTDLLTRLHHFSLKGRRVTITEAISYFRRHESINGNNLAFAARCEFVATKYRSGDLHLPELVNAALSRFPLDAQSSPVSPVVPVAQVNSQPPSTAGRKESVVQASKELGNAGEQLSVDLLIARGHVASLLSINYPTYDIKASRNGMEFYVSVKVSRTREHVRLGSRKSVLCLSKGNFVFAFLPRRGHQISVGG
jgi:hypothetical protein